MSAVSEEIVAGTTETRPLSAGWCRVRLAAVCEVNIETRDPHLEPDKPFRYVDITSVDNLRKRILSTQTRLGRDAPSRARQVIRAGDVIVSTTRPNLNAVAVVPPELDEQICSTGFCVLRPKSHLDPHYLFAFVKSEEFVENLSALVRGALYPAVTDGQVRAQFIPLAPLTEQKRIATILSEQMAAVERARAAAEAQLDAAKALPGAYLRAIFSTPEANAWRRVRLGDLLISPLKTGISKQTAPEATKRCLTLSAVHKGELDLAAAKPVDVNDDEAEGNLVKPDVFYVTRGNGNLSLVGRGALAPHAIPSPVLYPDLLIEVNVDPQKIDKKFLRWIWESDEIRRDIEARARTSAGIYKINQANLADVKLPLPPLHEQERIAAALAERMAVVERSRRVLENQLAEINALPGAFLRRAFRREL